ncbi:MAG: hypothetical protein COY74_01340 [Nitrosopumilales archaeon CG_4_10_14_0_8_um_filter_34_8]|nr:MAG: hypothetical protein COY74_01340 [Nitrosopumilales archaeon CG_4_10_14_0_8_um_filter_34_8]PJB97790.1 MAG: hypothetical protein CO079_05515 [Nitrosopumilales archaeon CG_4_9_14_0_8_um_filter_34_10]
MRVIGNRWIGWYFEYWCQKNLNKIMEMPFSKKYGNVSFDGYLEIPWDFKSHAIESGNKIIINDSEAISNAIKDFGCMGLILVTGSATYDNESEDFKKWHDMLKGGKSNYEINRIARNAPSRKRKSCLEITKIDFIRIDDKLLIKSGSFQENFRNSNGNPRRKKVLLDLTKINEHTEHIIDNTIK